MSKKMYSELPKNQLSIILELKRQQVFFRIAKYLNKGRSFGSGKNLKKAVVALLKRGDTNGKE